VGVEVEVLGARQHSKWKKSIVICILLSVRIKHC
jgi:hypothetical protein